MTYKFVFEWNGRNFHLKYLSFLQDDKSGKKLVSSHIFKFSKFKDYLIIFEARECHSLESVITPGVITDSRFGHLEEIMDV